MSLDSVDEWALWNLAQELNIWVHAFKETLDPSEVSELGFDLGASGDSVVKNLGEGCEFRSRMSSANFMECLNRAKNSSREIQTRLLTTRRANFGDEQLLNKAESLCTELSTSLGQFIQSLEVKS